MVAPPGGLYASKPLDTVENSARREPRQRLSPPMAEFSLKGLRQSPDVEWLRRGYQPGVTREMGRMQPPERDAEPPSASSSACPCRDSQYQESPGHALPWLRATYRPGCGYALTVFAKYRCRVRATMRCWRWPTDPGPGGGLCGCIRRRLSPGRSAHRRRSPPSGRWLRRDRR